MKFEPAIEAQIAIEMSGIPQVRNIDDLRVFLREQIDEKFTKFGEPGPEVDRVIDHAVATKGGQILVRTYHPENTTRTALPVHLMLHGGGWVSGSIDELANDAAARFRAVHANCVVAAVEYRLAPEHPFPAALDDVIASASWALAQASDMGADPTCLTLEGQSAGANLAAAALLASPALPVAGLILDVPAVDLTAETVTGDPLIGDDAFKQMLLHGLDTYTGDRSLATSPLVSPLLADDLSTFPPTLILTAELDALANGGQLFAEKLINAKVTCHHISYPGALHGSAILTKSWPTARKWRQDAIQFIQDIHSRNEHRIHANQQLGLEVTGDI